MDTSGNGLIKEGERLDSLQRNGYEILQHPGRFCFGMDAVLLSAFATVKPGEKVLDLCTGTGVLPILLEAKTKGEHFTGLEIQEESADMAARSVKLNRLEEKIDIMNEYGGVVLEHKRRDQTPSAGETDRAGRSNGQIRPGGAG